MLKIKFLIFIVTISLYSCQQAQLEEKKIFNYDKFEKIKIIAKKNIIQNFYESSFKHPYIDYSLNNPPFEYLNNWLENNISFIGNENFFEVNIIDSSLKKFEIKNKELKKFKEKTIFFYELNFLIEYILYDDSKLIIASSIVEVKRSTTSKKFISIQEQENIVNNLIFDCLLDLSNKSKEILKFHMKNYIL